MTYAQLQAALIAKRNELAAATNPPDIKTLCAENCAMVKQAIENEWWDLKDYGCDTAAQYCAEYPCEYCDD